MLIINKSCSFHRVVVVSCAGNNELAKQLHNHTIFGIFISTNRFHRAKRDEVTLQNKKLGIKNNDILKSLGKFVGSSPDLVGYIITEFGDIFTIGIQQTLDKVVFACEMCGYLARHESDLSLHKRTHGLVSIP